MIKKRSEVAKFINDQVSNPTAKDELINDLKAIFDEFLDNLSKDQTKPKVNDLKSIEVDGVRQDFRWIKPDTFRMGSPSYESKRNDNEYPRQVTLTEGFWLADTPVTQALWEAVMGENSSEFEGADRPVTNVSWRDAQDFINKLNEQMDGFKLRLPTEAEWEYACRAGTQTPFWFGENITTDQVNYDGTHPYVEGKIGEYRKETVEVKVLPCNSWGLYQMHGNIWEWCSDWYGEYPSGPAIDPTGPRTGEERVLRGGGWINFGRYARSAQRDHDAPDYRGRNTGFRLAADSGIIQS